MAAIKFDSGKPEWALVPMDSVNEMAKVLTWACTRESPKPYPRRNWEQGMDWSRMLSATYRHLYDFSAKVDFDHESGLFSLSHAFTDVGMLLAYQLRGVGNDDRA